MVGITTIKPMTSWALVVDTSKTARLEVKARILRPGANTDSILYGCLLLGGKLDSVINNDTLTFLESMLWPEYSIESTAVAAKCIELH